LRPGYAGAWGNLSLALGALGQAERARDAVERAIALDPTNTTFYLQLSAWKKFAADDPQLAAMEDLARDSATLSPDEQARLQFALGKALSDVGKHGRSFAAYRHGNVLKRRDLRYSEAATLAMFDRIRATFTAERIKDALEIGHPSPVPVFIVGMPRSGSTLVEQILASHPKVFGAGEIEDFKSAMDKPGGIVPFPEKAMTATLGQLREVGARYLESICKLAPQAERITDKMLANFLHVGLIHLALPHARIIHTRRDPVDTCLSCYTHWFAAGHEYSYDLGELGRYYRGYAALMAHWHAVLPPGIMLDVQYEAVVDDLEGEARRIIAHLGLDWNDACLAFHQTQRPVRTMSAAQVRQPLYRSAIERWRPDRAALEPLIDGLGAELLATHAS
jgi:hypothetical protein